MPQELSIQNLQQQHNSNSSIVEFKKSEECLNSKRIEALADKTDPFYIDVKNGFPYVKSSYMDDAFAKKFPIHKITVIGEPTVIQQYWIVYTVQIEAWVSPNISITKTGAGGARLQIPRNLKGKDGRPVRQITPLDFIDVGNDFKSALTKAIQNAQSKFGICGDVYNKGIIAPEIREKIENAWSELIKTIVNPIQAVQARNEWAEAKEKKRNLFDVYEKYFEQHPINLNEENNE